MDITFNFTYYAFICYSHKDAKWATWIQKALECYRLPSAIRKESQRPLPKKITPIFRDETDLGAGKLLENIHKELTASRYLIVICSPDSAVPNEEGKHWVDEEVRYFADELGRADAIIPVLVEGNPADAFCPKLKELDSLAIDATKIKRRRVLNDVVAKLLGLRPDELWRREIRRRRWKLLLRALTFAVLVGICAFAGWYEWDWAQERTTYFADYVERFGVPEGICPLHPEQIVGRGQTYRFHYQGYDSFIPGKRRPVLRKVFCVNSFDHIRNESNGRPLHPQTAGLRFHYDEKLTVTKVEHIEVDGTIKAIFRYSGPGVGIVDVIRRGGDGRLGTVARILPITGKDARQDEIGRYHITRDEHGHVIRAESYRDARGIPVADSRGVYRTDYQLDGAGRVVAELYYSWNGQRVLCGDGIDGMQYAYDATGSIAELHGVKDGKRVFSEVYEYDAQGNRTKTKKESLDVARPVKGWVEQRKKYDEYGEMVRLEHFDANGNAAKYTDSRWERKVRFKDGCLVEEDVSYFDEKGDVGQVNGVARRITRYDSNMRTIEVIHFDKNGNLLDSSKLASSIKQKFDENGRLVEYLMSGADGNGWCEAGQEASGYRCVYEMDGEFLSKTMRYFKCLGLGMPVGRFLAAKGPYQGAACEKTIYDKVGRVVSVRLFDADDKAFVGPRGWHETKFKYDRHGFLSEVTYLGVDGKPVMANGSDEYGVVAAVRFANDAAGNTLEISLLGVDGELMLGKNGYAMVKQRFDSRGLVTEQSLFGVDGDPVAPEGGNCRKQYQYDDCGMRIVERNFSLDGTYRVLHYDANRCIIRDECFTAEGLPKTDENGVHAILYKRDAKGREIKKGFLDIHNKPVLNEERIAGLMTTYDEQGAVVEEIRFGVNGELIRDNNGVCIVRWEYDSQHREIAKTFYDTHTNRVENKNGVAGVRKAYDKDGNLCEEYNIDGVDGLAKPDDNGVAIVYRLYDCGGRVVKRTYYDASRKPILGKDQTAGWKSEYEGDSNFETVRRFFGLDGKPCKCAAGHSGWVKEYDERGNVTKFMLIDEQGGPVLGQDGTAGWLQKYDIRNRIVESRLIGKDGNPCCQHLDFSALGLGFVAGKYTESRYDMQGRKTVLIFLEKECDGISRIVQKYNLAGDIVELRFEGRDGVLMGLSNGVARVENKYNYLRELTERKWFGVDGRPCGMGGVYKIDISYERMQNGLRRRVNNYGVNGFPVDNENGVAVSDEVYDSEHRLICLETRNAMGNLTCEKGAGFAHIEVNYEAHGFVANMTCLDANGGGAINGCTRLEFSYSFSNEGELQGALVKGYDAEGNLMHDIKISALAVLEYSRKVSRYWSIKFGE